MQNSNMSPVFQSDRQNRLEPSSQFSGVHHQDYLRDPPNIVFRSPRSQELERTVIYLNDNPSHLRHLRATNFLADPSPLFLQRSASARLVRIKPSSSTTNLFTSIQSSEERIPQLRSSCRDRVSGFSHDERQNVLVLPMFGYLRRHRSRHRPHRLSADIDTLRGHQLEMDGNIMAAGAPPSFVSQRQQQTSQPTDETDELSDRPIIFTNPNNRSTAQSSVMIAPPQTLSLRSPNHESSAGLSHNRSSNRVTNQTVRSNQLISNRPSFPLPTRRVSGNPMNMRYLDHTRSSDSLDFSNNITTATTTTVTTTTVTATAVTTSTTNVTMTSTGSNTTTPAMSAHMRSPHITTNAQPPHISVVTTTTATASISTLDDADDDDDGVRAQQVREIHLLPNNPQNVIAYQQQQQQQQAQVMDNQSHTTSISDASSIEDLNASDVTEVQSNCHNINEVNVKKVTIVSAKRGVEETQTQTDAFCQPMDWRTNLGGSHELWHEILKSERFADVWFIVGSENVRIDSPLTISSTSCKATAVPTSLNSNNLNHNKNSSNKVCESGHKLLGKNNRIGKSNTDLGAPGGPTSYLHSTNLAKIRSSCSHTNLLRADHEISEIIEAIESEEDDNGEEENTEEDCQTQSLGEESEHHAGTTHKSNYQCSSNCKSDNDDCETLVTDPPVYTDQSDKVNQPAIRKRANQNSDIPVTVNCHDVLRDETVICRFAAHKLILAAASPVFEAMFYGPVAQYIRSTGDAQNEYCIPDIHPKAFQIMLRYVYSDEIVLDDNFHLSFYVLYAAKKYILPNLIRICVEHLKEQITAENVCFMLDRSIFFDEQDLTNRCWHVIDVLASDVLSSRGLLTMNTTNLQDLVRRDTLNCRESEVFAAVCRWAAAECARFGIRNVVPNKVQIAQNILSLIRFPTMTLNDFAENVAKSRYLSLEMVCELFVYITNKSKQISRTHKSPSKRSPSLTNISRDTEINILNNTDAPISMNSTDRLSLAASIKLQSIRQLNPPAPGPFPCEPRTGPKLWHCARFTRTRKHLSTLPCNNTHHHSVCFEVANPIFLAGIGVYGSTQVGEVINSHVHLKLVQDNTYVSKSKKAPLSCSSTTNQRRNFNPSQINSNDGIRNINNNNNNNNNCLNPNSTELNSRSTNDLTNARNYPISNRISYPNIWSNIYTDNLNDVTPSSTVFASAVDIRMNNLIGTRELNIVEQNSHLLASKEFTINSDGSNKVYTVKFDCPVKLVAGQSYLLNLSTCILDNGTRKTSNSSNNLNSFTSYIGMFGRPEIMVFCSTTDKLLAANNIKDHHHQQKSTQISSHSRDSHTIQSNKQSLQTQTHTQTVTFRFLESWNGVESGDVDRGFIPDLLFYTCF